MADEMKRFQCKDYDVLVVDDNDINRKVVGEMIASYGISVDEAESGEEAVAKAKNRSYDMIFMDHVMHGMNGIETAEAILENYGEDTSVPVLVALSADAGEDTKGTYIRSGFQDYMTKPVEWEALHAVLDEWIPESKKEYKEEEEIRDAISEEGLIRLFMLDVDVVSAVVQQRSIGAYLELLDLFYMAGVQKVDLLKKLIEEQNIKNYVIEVHGLKSAAANIGALSLSEMAKQHEVSGKASDIDFIRKNADSLLEAYHNILMEIRRVLSQHGYGQFAGTDRTKLPEIGEQDMFVWIEKILRQLETFKPKEAANELEELLGYAMPEKVREQLEQVQVMLKIYQDDEAEEMLEALIESLQG